MTAPHVIVVGGGIAGLVAARELVAAGIRVTLLEASGRLGGKVAPHTVGGIELDAGAESFATRGGTVAALVTELGLGDLVVGPRAGGAWLLSAEGRALPLPNAGLLGIPSAPLARDVVRIVGLPGALRAQLDRVLPASVGSRERSLGGLVRRRMGRAVLDRLVTPVASAIHSAHPDDLDADTVAPRVRSALLSSGSLARAVLTVRQAAPAGAAVQGLAGGIFRITAALAAELAARPDLARIRLDTPVAAVDAAGVTLLGGSRLDADAVVLAAELGEPSGVPITVATLVVRLAALDAAPRGTGLLVAAGAPGIRAKALTHATAKWEWLASVAGGAHVLRLSYATAPESDAELRELARTDAALLLGLDVPAESVLAFDRVVWTGPASKSMSPRAEAAAGSGIVTVGERVSGAGLAAVIGHAKREAANLGRDLAEKLV